MTIEVVCALILRNGCVLCAQRSERMALPLKWEFPGGKLELNELPESALNGVRTIRLIPFLASIIDNNEPKAHEHSEIRWVTNSELIQLDWAAADVPIVLEYINRS